MKTKIWKYRLEKTVMQSILLPIGYNILTAQVQHKEITLWVEVNPDEKKMIYVDFMLHGTGQTLEMSQGKYINTLQLFGGDLVLHLYKVN